MTEAEEHQWLNHYLRGHISEDGTSRTWWEIPPGCSCGIEGGKA